MALGSGPPELPNRRPARYPAETPAERLLLRLLRLWLRLLLLPFLSTSTTPQDERGLNLNAIDVGENSS